MRLKSFTAAVMLAVLPGIASAASVLTFDDRCSGATMCSYTFDGITATLSNAATEVGGSTFYANENGLVLGSGGLTRSFDIVFDTSVALSNIAYEFVFGNSNFTLTGPGVNLALSGVNNSTVTVSPVADMLAGQVYTFYSPADNSDAGTGGVTMASLTFNAAPVPVPASLVLLATAFAGFGALTRRRRA